MIYDIKLQLNFMRYFSIKYNCLDKYLGMQMAQVRLT